LSADFNSIDIFIKSALNSWFLVIQYRIGLNKDNIYTFVGLKILKTFLMLQLKNNFIFAPVKTGYSDNTGIITEKHVNFYLARSKHIGAVTLEPLYLDKSLREIPTQIGIDSDDKIDGLKKLIDKIHQFDTKVIAHLNHPGRMANPKIPGNVFFSSTNIACETGGAEPKQMGNNEIQSVINLFTDSAKRAEKAGFDIIELQFGHGYLVAQFLSPKVNDREDEYGGSFENRIKFPLQILDAIKSGTNLPVIVRISGDEMLPDGIKLPEMIKFSKILKEAGIDAIHVSAGTVCSTPPWYFQHMFVPKGKTWEFANKIKQEAGIPTIFVGQINTKDDIKNLTDNFNADYIAIGRALIADPDFVGKYLNKVNGNIRPCLACAEGCLGNLKQGKGLGCLVNPLVGKDAEKLTLAKSPKHFAIIGGGLAGMQAALTLNKRGHKVTLFEKNKLGGQFNLAYLPPKKETLKKIIDYFVEELRDKNIEIINKDITEANIEFEKYNGIILATGAKPAIPPIEGLENYYLVEYIDRDDIPKNKNIFIIGGGLIGVEIATVLARDNNIIIVKRTVDFGEDMELISKMLSLNYLKDSNVKFFDKTNITRIDKNKIYAERNGEDIKFEDIDMIFVSTGMESYNPLEREFKKLNAPVFIIGDSKKVGKAEDAIQDAYETVKNL